ncbi:MAG: hypothetical protein R6U70_05800 [Bacillota bacterium]
MRVHGHVVSLLPEKKAEYEFEISEPVPVADLVQKRLGINPDVFATVLIDGKRRKKDHLLEEDCDIVLISPLAGG